MRLRMPTRGSPTALLVDGNTPVEEEKVQYTKFYTAGVPTFHKLELDNVVWGWFIALRGSFCANARTLAAQSDFMNRYYNKGVDGVGDKPLRPEINIELEVGSP